MNTNTQRLYFFVTANWLVNRSGTYISKIALDCVTITLRPGERANNIQTQHRYITSIRTHYMKTAPLLKNLSISPGSIVRDCGPDAFCFSTLAGNVEGDPNELDVIAIQDQESANAVFEDDIEANMIHGADIVVLLYGQYWRDITRYVIK